jgi:uncharacterized Zn-finger protein
LTKPSLPGKSETLDNGQNMSETNKTSTPDPEIVYVDKRRVACDGGGALGHPLVWYSLEDGEAECGYCDRKFIYRPNSSEH